MLAVALALIGPVFGGASQSTAKRGVQSLSPSVFLAIKWATGGLVFSTVVLATGAWREFRWNEGTVAMLAASIVGPVIAWSMYSRALLLLDVAVAVTISELNLLWGMLLSVIFLGERPNLFTAIGAVGIVAGAALVHPRPRPASAAHEAGAQPPPARLSQGNLRRGVLLALGTSVAWGVNLFLFKIGADNLTPVQANWTRTSIPGLIWTLFFLYRFRSRRLQGLPALYLPGRGVAFAMATSLLADVLDWTLRFAALGMAPASIVIPLTGTEPLFAALIARATLGEAFTVRQGIGLLLVVAGVALVASLGRGQ